MVAAREREREREMTRSGGKDVNAIWAQLKAQNQPSGRREREREEEVSRKETAEASAPVASSVVARDAECECFDGFQDVEGAENLLKRTINSLTEGDYLTRRRAIRTLAASLRSCENAELRTDVFVEVVAKHLLRRFEDKSEACRELAVKCIAENVEACKEDAVESLLPYCVPVLGERLGLSGGPDADRRSLIELGAEILQASHVNRVDITDFSRASSKRGQAVEPSEEVRILLIGLLRSLVRHGTHTIKPYAQDFCEILLCCARDPFHEALVESCACLCDLVATLGAKLWMVSKIMLAGYAPVLSHRRQQVRVSAIRAISALVFNGAHESLLDLCSFRDPNVVPVRAFFGDDIKVNYMGKLITDSCANVRRELVKYVGSWLLELPERRDHESRLLPYLLSGLIDEDDRVRRGALETLEKLGDLYIKDNAEDLKDKLYYLPTEAHGHGWMDGGVWRAIEEGRVTTPEPFRQRPSLGSRLLVQQNFKGSLGALASELSSWQEQPRLKAAKLLRVFLVCMEDYVASCLERLLPALCHAGCSEDAQITRAVLDASRTLSWYTDPGLSLQILGPRLSPEFDRTKRASAARVLAAVVRGSAEAGTIAGHEAEVAAMVADNGLDSTGDTALKRAAVEVCEAAVPAIAGGEGDDAIAARDGLVGSLVLLTGGWEPFAPAAEVLKTVLGALPAQSRAPALASSLLGLCAGRTLAEGALPPETHAGAVCGALDLALDGLQAGLSREEVLARGEGGLVAALSFLSAALGGSRDLLSSSLAARCARAGARLLEVVSEQAFGGGDREALLGLLAAEGAAVPR